jgi:hypothetical protein
VKYCALQHTLEPQCRLNLSIIFFGQQWCLLVNALDKLAAQFRYVYVTRLQNLMDPGDIEEREQQVLHRHILMTKLTGSLKSLVQTKFQLTAEHTDKLLS